MTSSKPIDKDPPQQISQPHIPLTKPLLPPLTALIPLLEEIWRNGWVTNNGPLQRRLEATLTSQLGWKNVVSTANGTLALQLACRALGLEGEVITPSFTFPATVQALIWNNLIPVFGDIEPEHLTLNPDAVTSLISPRTSCILAVHTFGYAANVRGLQQIATQHGLALLYDAAPAVGVEVDGRSITDFGDACAVSFHATKVMHTVEGGAVCTADKLLAERVRTLRNFGLRGSEPPFTHGTNAKLNELQAAVGLLVLKELSTEIRKRQRIMMLYSVLLDAVPGVQLLRPSTHTKSNHAYAVARFRLDGQPLAATVQQHLTQFNIDSRRYFGPPYRMQGVLTPYPTPIADAATEDVLCLPLWGALPESAVQHICGLIAEAMV